MHTSSAASASCSRPAQQGALWRAEHHRLSTQSTAAGLQLSAKAIVAPAAAGRGHSHHAQQRQLLAAPRAAAAPDTDRADLTPTATPSVKQLKLRLLLAVASLDRGLAANAQDARLVDGLAQQLETAAGAPDIELLPGTWRLLYTSGFNTGSLGGTRPGPPAALVPSTLGQVYQRIDGDTKRLDNIVEFLFTATVPSLSNLIGNLPGSLGQGAVDPATGRVPAVQVPELPAVRLTLAHDYQLVGSSTVEITYEDTSAELVGSSLFSNLPKFDLPQLPEALRPPKNFRSATFDVVFLDEGLRVTRGDRGELRVYARDDGSGAPTLGGWDL